jgi:hypothetical protein
MHAAGGVLQRRGPRRQGRDPVERRQFQTAAGSTGPEDGRPRVELGWTAEHERHGRVRLDHHGGLPLRVPVHADASGSASDDGGPPCARSRQGRLEHRSPIRVPPAWPARRGRARRPGRKADDGADGADGQGRGGGRDHARRRLPARVYGMRAEVLTQRHTAIHSGKQLSLVNTRAVPESFTAANTIGWAKGDAGSSARA